MLFNLSVEVLGSIFIKQVENLLFREYLLSLVEYFEVMLVKDLVHLLQLWFIKSDVWLDYSDRVWN
jgi:hypothetical protein